jgi:pyruvate dehydrogenase phosphatase regulatory subunit
MGYERPMFFKLKKPQSLELGLMGLDQQEAMDSSQGEMMKLPLAKTEVFFRPPWFQAAAEEFQASREAVTVCDYSSFAKHDLWSAGREVVDFLQMLCSNDVDVPVGHIIHTGMQNQWGGYENDCSVARLAENRYMLMSPSIQQMRSFTWMKRHLPADGSVVLQDVTSLYTALCVMGPFSRALTSRLTTESLDSRSFPFFTCRYMDIACAPDILTMNMTHTGELGYVFYIPNEFAIHVYDAINEVRILIEGVEEERRVTMLTGGERVRPEAVRLLRHARRSYREVLRLLGPGSGQSLDADGVRTRFPVQDEVRHSVHRAGGPAAPA